MLQPVNFLTQEHEKINCNVIKSVRDHLGGSLSPPQRSQVHDTESLHKLSPCPVKIKHSATQQTTVSVEELKLKNYNVTWKKNRRAAIVKDANVKESLTTTVQPVCCDHSFQMPHYRLESRHKNKVGICYSLHHYPVSISFVLPILTYKLVRT